MSMEGKEDYLEKIKQLTESVDPLERIKKLSNKKGDEKKSNKKKIKKQMITHYKRNHKGERIYPYGGRKSTQRKKISNKEVQETNCINDIDQLDVFVESGNDEHHNESNIEDIKKLIETALSLFSHLPRKRKKKQVWAQRVSYVEGIWEEERDRLEAAEESTAVIIGKCSSCDLNGVVRCTDCGNLSFCHLCDDACHLTLPLHNRVAYLDGYLQPLSVNEIVDDNLTVIETERFVPLLSGYCSCGCRKFIKRNVDKLTIVITLTGRFELFQYVDVCFDCGAELDPFYLENIIQSGFWPHSPQHVTTLFKKEVFVMWDQFRKQMPGSSEKSFLESLNCFTLLNGRKDRITPATFSISFKNWCFTMYRMNQIQKKDFMKCPMCNTNQHSCHVDGNCKLSRFRSSGRRTRPNFYGDIFIQDDKKVAQFLKDFALLPKDKNPQDTFCGGDWTAARNKSITKASLDTTGLELLACRHQLGQQALNMKRGELYGYATYLVKHFAMKQNVSFVFADVICKLWGFMTKVDPSIGEKSKGALSVMHAKGHSIDCQLQWDGEWVEGTGRSTGEECEQIFSYLSRCNNTTKHQKPENREETITELMLFWNEKKVDKMAESTIKKYRKVSKDLHHHETNLRKITKQLNLLPKNLNLRRMMEDIRKNICGGRHFEGIITRPKAILLILHDLSMDVPTEVSSNVREAIKKFKLPDLRDVCIPLLRKSKEQKLIIMKDSWHLVKIESLQNEWQALKEEVLIPTFRRAIESAYFEIVHWKTKIKKMADTSKRRTKLRQMMGLSKAKMTRLLKEYGNLQEENIDIENGNFPWKVSEPSTISDVNKRLLAEVMSKKQRCTEELKLIEIEMESYIRYYTTISSNLKFEIESNEIFPGDNPDQIIKRRCRTSLLRTGLEYASIQLKKGIDLFCPVISPNANFVDNVEYDEKDFENDNTNDNDGNNEEQPCVEESIDNYEIDESEITLDALKAAGGDVFNFTLNECDFRNDNDTCFINFPVGFCQTGLNGVLGSSACAVISLIAGYYFSKFKLNWQDPSIDIVPLYLGSIETGNLLKDSPYNLSIQEAVELVPNLSVSCGEERNSLFENLEQFISNIRNAQFMIIVSDDKTFCVVKDENFYILLDSHGRNGHGALIVRSVSTKTIANNIFFNRETPLLYICYIDTFW